MDMRASLQSLAEAATTRVRVRYPLARGRIVLRAEPDWTTDLEPLAVSRDGTSFDFEVPADRSHRYCKPVLIGPDGEQRWAVGHDYLLLASREILPYFGADERCSECELLELADTGGRRHRFRVFYPPGYQENTLRRYPVLYMQDGQNLFFPDEAFGGRHWRIAETLRLLDAMNAVEQVIVVGIYPQDREIDYTAPGYEAYADFLVSALKPYVDGRYRTLTGAAHTAVMGSSLGGVVSLHLALRHPDVFGAAACLSSTFGWRDDLADRIEHEPKRSIRIYLDSGWPNDNYEATRRMHARLAARGFVPGRDLHYFAFPNALHDEVHWAMRAHLPLQLLFGTGAQT
jgi:predicted alpha/beta superfamily hydrolase